MNTINRRFTKQRRLVLEVLQKSHSHPTAEEIYASLKSQNPEISLGTVYRNLNVLCEMGEAKKVKGDFPSDRFDIAAPDHYHFQCKECKEVFDLMLPYDGDLDSELRYNTDHVIYSHDILFCGVCKFCKK